MKDEDKTKEQLINELVELRQQITKAGTSEAQRKRAKQAIPERRIWLPVAGMFVLLCILVWLNEIADLPSLLLGAPHTAINWREAITEMVLIAGLGLFAVLRLIRDITERKRAEEELRKYRDHLEELVEERSAELMKVNEQLQREITERKRAEEELRAEKEFSENMLNALVDTVFVFDPNTGNPLRWNKAFNEISGCTDEEIASKKAPDDWYSEEDLRRAEAATEKVFLEGQATVEMSLITKDERLIPTEYTGSLIKDAEGKPQYLIAVGRDITARKWAEEALRESEERYRSLFDGAEDHIFVVDQDFRYVMVNAGALKAGGFTLEDAVGKGPHELFPEDAEFYLSQYRHVFETGKPVWFERELRLPDGLHWFSATLSPIKDARGRVIALTGISRDITERKRAEEALQVSHHFLEIANRHTEMFPLLKEFVAEVRNFTRCAAVGLRMLDEEGNIPYQAYRGFSQRFYESESPLSIKSDQCMCINVIKGATDPKLSFYTEGGSFYMNDTTRFLATVSEEEKGRTRNVCNQFGYESVALIPIRVGERILGLIHIADPQENMVPVEMVEVLEGAAMQLGTAIQRVLAEEELAYMATHDALTRLPNRMLFNDRLTLALAHAHRNQQMLAVMLLDLDHFKDVNDTLGHSVGDKLLQIVGGRLTSLLRKSDTAARMGGDEFMLILPEIARWEDATKIAQKILGAIRKPFEFDGHKIHITTSIGIATYPTDGEDADTLMRSADIAMYRAKEQGRDNYQHYTPAIVA